MSGQGNPQPKLQCAAVDVFRSRQQILRGVDLHVDTDETVALLGTNGAGKSTLLDTISGLLRARRGTIALDGMDITRSGALAIARAGVVHVSGGKAIFPDLTVAEHFTAASWLHDDQPKQSASDRVERLLDQFEWLRMRWRQRAGALSGGEQQQLALAMAMATRPRLLLIDELSLGLSPAVVTQTLDMVRAIRAERCSVLLVEQSLEIALEVADRAYYLERGQVTFSGAATELAARDNVARSVFLAGAIERFPHPPERRTSTATDRIETESNDPILTVRAACRRFGGVPAVDNVDLVVRPRQILGLIGPNGAGKTTLLDIISGHLPLDRGEIRLGAHDITRWPAYRRAEAGLGRSFQDARQFPSLTVAEVIAVARDRHLAVRDHVPAMLGLPAAVRSEREMRGSVDELLHLLNLVDCRDALVGELSTGVRRLAELAAKLAHVPTVLLLDEPSSGLAQSETAALGDLLVDIRDRVECAMVIVEHDVPLITSIADELVVLDLGRVICRGRPSDVVADPRVVSAYLGRPAAG